MNSSILPAPGVVRSQKPAPERHSKQIAYARDLQEDMQSFLVSLHDKVMKAGKTLNPLTRRGYQLSFSAATPVA